MADPIFALPELVGWARRAAGDTFQSTSETIGADGTPRIALNADGAITVTGVEVNFVEVDENSYEVNGNTITFSSDIPSEGDDVLVRYASARYEDSQIIDFIKDAARGVRADMKFHWLVDEDSGDLTDRRYELFDVNDVPNIKGEIEQLIVLRAAVTIYADKTNAAADGAIMIKNGDTTIETGKTAQATEKALGRLMTMYKDAVKKARAEGFMGVASDGMDFFDYPDGSRAWRYNRWL